MKRNFIFILFIISSIQVYAQSKINYRAGLNLFKSNVNWGGDKFYALPGFYFGGIYNIPLKNTKIRIRPEISYTKERFQYRAPIGNEWNIKFIFNYLNIPIMAGYKVNEKLDLEGGLQYALLINSNTSQRGVKYKNFPAKTSYGLGIGFRYSLHPSGIILQARYSKGLKCVCRLDKNYAREIDPEKISGLELGIIFKTIRF